MPRYDYRCNECDQVFEVRRSMTETEKTEECPGCHSQHTARVYAAPYVNGATSKQQSSTSSGCGCGGCSGSSCGSCHH